MVLRVRKSLQRRGSGTSLYPGGCDRGGAGATESSVGPGTTSSAAKPATTALSAGPGDDVSWDGAELPRSPIRTHNDERMSGGPGNDTVAGLGVTRPRRGSGDDR